MPGFVANPFAWMRRASVFVSSSVTEGCPNALMQALASARRSSARMPSAARRRSSRTAAGAGSCPSASRGRWPRQSAKASMPARSRTCATRAVDFSHERIASQYLEVAASGGEYRVTSASGSPSPALVCPVDHQALAADAAGQSLACPSGHAFPVRDGIPRLLPSGENYADAFGEQWKQYRRTQLDSYTRTTYSKDRLRRCFGEALWQRLQQPDRCRCSRPVAARVGSPKCCSGRRPRWSRRRTSARPSSRTRPIARSRRATASCNATSTSCRSCPGQFDIVMCLGVVQHTRDPERTIADLYRQVRPGGWLVIDHYRHAVSTYTKVTAGLMRPVLKRLPPRGASRPRRRSRAGSFRCIERCAGTSRCR